MQSARARLTNTRRVLGAAFSTPDLRRLQLAWSATALAHWSYFVVVSVWAYDAGGATAVGLVGLTRLLPSALAAPATSLLVDRHSRRQMLLAASLLRAGGRCAAAGAVALGAPFGVVLVILALQQIASTAYKPAQAALLPVLAGTPHQMAAANAVWAGIDNAGFCVGALLGGWLAATTSASVGFAATSLPLLVAALLVARITPDRVPAHREVDAGAELRQELTMGFRTIARHPELRLVQTTLAATTLIEGIVDVLVVVTAIELLGAGNAGVGYLNSAWGIGGLIGGACALALLGRGRIASGLAIGATLAGLALGSIAAEPTVIVALVALTVLGVGYSLVEVAGLTLMQRLASDEVLGRVFGVFESAYAAATAIGSALAPALISLLGIRGAIGVSGGALLVIVALRRGALARLEAGVRIPEREFALLRDTPLFAPLPIAVVENMAQRLEPVDVEPGDTVIREGEEGDRFYLIAEGEFLVSQGEQALRTQHAPGFFGEIALLRAVPRTATVEAVTAGLLYALPSDDFIAGMTGNRRSARAAEVVIEDRLDHSSRVESV
ncbi:MAG: MFS transporter [Thermoleophilaceae bacterium]